MSLLGCVGINKSFIVRGMDDWIMCQTLLKKSMDHLSPSSWTAPFIRMLAKSSNQVPMEMHTRIAINLSNKLLNQQSLSIRHTLVARHSLFLINHLPMLHFLPMHSRCLKWTKVMVETMFPKGHCHSQHQLISWTLWKNPENDNRDWFSKGPSTNPGGTWIDVKNMHLKCSPVCPWENDGCCMAHLSKQDDFANQVSMLETVIKEAGYECIFLPKFHCELNPIEMVS